MDFGALPPEINSGRMYLGPGPATLLAAAAAWETLASELHTAASGYQSAIASLTDESWIGPSSLSMASAIAPYLIWMRHTAAQCEVTATRATAAASAYETAFALTVPPPVVEANRVQLATLVATNLLGQNTPAIMATEVEYGEMWAQDATAMYGYAANSASASAFSPFAPAPRTTNPQASSPVGALQAAGSTAQSTSSQSMSTVPQALQSLSTPGSSSAMGTATGMASSAASAPPSALSGLTGTSKGASKSASTGMRAASGLAAGGASGLTGETAGLASDAAGFGSDAAGLGTDGGGIGLDLYGVSLDMEGAESILGAEGSGASGLGALGGLAPMPGLGTGAAAGLGQAAPLGTLSVPPGWAHAVSSVAPLPAAEGATPAGWGAASASPPSAAVSKLPLGGMVGRESGGAVQRVGHQTQLIPRSRVIG